MAKFGYLYLHNGRWEDKQIVPESWVKKSTSSLTRLNDEVGYGYQWWTMPKLEAYRASGLYGQQIFVSPKEDLVFVLTAGISQNQHAQEERLFQDYVPAAVSDSGESNENSIKIPATPILSIFVGLLVSIVFLFSFTSRKP